MCRALRVLCAAGTPERLAELKRACVATAWELVGGASSGPELLAQIEEWSPDVLVLDARIGGEAVAAARSARPRVRIVTLGGLPGADEVATSMEDLRSAILGLPRPGGPVGR